MEDEGVGEETTAQAAAFFDVALDSPRVSASGGPAVSAGAGVTAAPPAAALAGNGGSGGGGGRPGRDPRSTSSGGGDGDKLDRESTAAEMWMYGDAAATGPAQE